MGTLSHDGETALAMLETGFFARWIVWFGAASGALAIAGDASILDPTGPLGGVGIVGFLDQLLFLVWLIVVGVSLLRHSPVPTGKPESRLAPLERDLRSSASRLHRLKVCTVAVSPD